MKVEFLWQETYLVLTVHLSEESGSNHIWLSEVSWLSCAIPEMFEVYLLNIRVISYFRCAWMGWTLKKVEGNKSMKIEP